MNTLPATMPGTAIEDPHDWCVCGHIRGRHQDFKDVCNKHRYGVVCGCETFIANKTIEMMDLQEAVENYEIQSPEQLARQAGIKLAQARSVFASMQGVAEEELKARRVEYMLTILPEMMRMAKDPSKPPRFRERLEKKLAQRLGMGGSKGAGVSVNISNTNAQQTVVNNSFDAMVRQISEENKG